MQLTENKVKRAKEEKILFLSLDILGFISYLNTIGNSALLSTSIDGAPNNVALVSACNI